MHVGRRLLALRRVIVPDLPAHGARFKEQPLTLGNAVSTLYEVIQQEAPGKRVRYSHLLVVLAHWLVEQQ